MSDLPIIDRLARLGACDVADALMTLQHPYGGFLSDLIMCSPEQQAGDAKIVGRAFTVKFVLNDDTSAPKVPQGHYIDKLSSGDVLFISAPSGIVNAVYGGLMSTRATFLGAVGTVVDGRIRDLQEHRNLGYPVFAKGSGTTAGQQVARPSEINVSVRLNSTEQEAWVHPGDYIIADLNGVVCIPAAMASEAVQIAETIVKRDEKCAEDIRNGRSVTETFKEHRGKT